MLQKIKSLFTKKKLELKKEKTFRLDDAKALIEKCNAEMIEINKVNFDQNERDIRNLHPQKIYHITFKNGVKKTLTEKLYLGNAFEISRIIGRPYVPPYHRSAAEKQGLLEEMSTLVAKERCHVVDYISYGVCGHICLEDLKTRKYLKLDDGAEYNGDEIFSIYEEIVPPGKGS